MHVGRLVPTLTIASVLVSRCLVIIAIMFPRALVFVPSLQISRADPYSTEAPIFVKKPQDEGAWTATRASRCFHAAERISEIKTLEKLDDVDASS